MNDYGLKVGDVVWQMRGIPKDDTTVWFARPICIEKADEHKFLDATGCGGSWTCIGKNYFLTREEALKNFEAHRAEYDKQAVTSAAFNEQKRLGAKVKDGKTFWRGEETFFVFVRRGLERIEIVDSRKLPWKKDEEAAEYGGPEEYITLGDIREALGEHQIITVWACGPLHGEIYQTGNYPKETAWRLYGQLMGYA